MRLTRVGGVAAIGALFLMASEVPALAQVYRPSAPGVSNPVLVRQVMPTYSAEALRAGIQGLVELEAVVLQDGSVGAVRVTRSLDQRFGLDERAVMAARQWRFTPARLGERPVSMAVTLIVEFRLKDAAQAPQVETFAPGVARQDDAGVFPPVVLKSVTPRYSAEAMREKIQGSVTVQAVVDTTGVVTDAKVLKSLDAVYGLDDAALAAAREWRFAPGTFEGRPIPVAITLVLEFRLH